MRKATLTLRKPLSAREEMTAAIGAFYRRCEARNLSTHTTDYYRHRFAAFTAFLEARDLDVSPAEVTPAIVRDFLADETTRVSPLTAQHSFVTLRCFFRFLEEEETVPANPMVKVQPVKLRRKVMTTFGAEAFQAMLDTAGKDFSGLRLRALLLTLADTGLRVSELCGLTIADVSLDEQTMKVLGKGNKERMVAFGKVTRQALSAYLSRRGDAGGNDRIFVTCYGDPMTRQRVHRLLADCGTKANVSDVTPHNFRRFFAREFVAGGGDCFVLQKALGHTSLEMSRRYCELASVDVLDAQRRLSPADRMPQVQTGGRQRLK